MNRRGFFTVLGTAAVVAPVAALTPAEPASHLHSFVAKLELLNAQIAAERARIAASLAASAMSAAHFGAAL